MPACTRVSFAAPSEEGFRLMRCLSALQGFPAEDGLQSARGDAFGLVPVRAAPCRVVVKSPCIPHILSHRSDIHSLAGGAGSSLTRTTALPHVLLSSNATSPSERRSNEYISG